MTTRGQVADKRRVFLGLGSNLGDRWQYLRNAVVALPDVTAVSPIYETEPIGGPENQGPYLNMVVQLHTDLGPRRLLRLCKQLEDEAGRVRTEPNGPRTLDVDILLIGHERIQERRLEVPHPRMWERRFVLAPLSDLAPDLLPTGWQARAVGQVEQVGSL